MNPKLINLNVYDARNVICAWNTEDDQLDFGCGIALETASRQFIVPQYIIVGVFDDGSTKAAGIFDFDDLNSEDDIFTFNHIVSCVGISEAKAFVRGNISERKYDNETSAKADIYDDLVRSGVRITKDAKDYLCNRKKQNEWKHDIDLKRIDETNPICNGYIRITSYRLNSRYVKVGKVYKGYAYHPSIDNIDFWRVARLRITNTLGKRAYIFLRHIDATWEIATKEEYESQAEDLFDNLHGIERR